MEHEIENIIKELALIIQKAKTLNDKLIVYVNVEKKHNSKISIIDFIITLVSEYEKIQLVVLKSKKKAPDIVAARHICMALLDEYTNLNYAAIGKLFSCDRSSISHAVSKIKDYIEVKDKSIINYEYYQTTIEHFRNNQSVEERHTNLPIVKALRRRGDFNSNVDTIS